MAIKSDGKRRNARVLRAGGALLAGLGVLASSGCASWPPVRSLRAARGYAEGTRALERGETRVAIAELERAAQLMPNASEIQNHLGLAYWSDARETDAERAFLRAVALDCANDAARGNLARLRAGRGEGSDAHGG